MMHFVVSGLTNMEMLTKTLPSLLAGTKITLLVFGVTLAMSLPLAIALSFIRELNSKIINRFIGIYTYIERGTPLLLQLMFVFFGLPYLGIVISRELAIVIAFVLNYTAYLAEILRGGMNAINDGQYQTGKVLGLSNLSILRKIMLPQAIKNSLPAIGNEVLSLVKDTSLIYILGASELLKAGRGAVNTYASAIPFIYVAIIYLAISAVCTLIMKKIESRYDYY